MLARCDPAREILAAAAAHLFRHAARMADLENCVRMRLARWPCRDIDSLLARDVEWSGVNHVALAYPHDSLAGQRIERLGILRPDLPISCTFPQFGIEGVDDGGRGLFVVDGLERSAE